MTTNGRPFAIVTGASSGIGRELARLCAQNGYDLLIAADEPEIHEAAQELRTFGGQVEAQQVDLATLAGVDAGQAARCVGHAVGHVERHDDAPDAAA